MKKVKLTVWAILLVLMAFLVACSDSTSNQEVDPKQILADSVKKSQEMESMTFEGQYVLSFDFESMDIPQEAKGFLDILKDLTVNYSGAYQKDLQKAEITLEAQVNLGDLKSIIELPILLEGEKIWLKIPDLPGFIPDEYSGQYLEIDLKELAELSGEEYVPMFPENAEEEQAMLSLAFELVDIFLDNVDDSYFTVSTEEGTVVTFDFSGDRIYDIIEKMITESLPELYNVLSVPEHQELLGITQEDLDEFKQLENEIPEDLFAELDELKEVFKVNKGEMSVQLGDDGFVTNEVLSFDGMFSDPDSNEETNVSFDLRQSYSNINEEQEFTLEAPGSNVLNLTELMDAMMMGGMYYDEDFSDYELSRVDELQFELAQEEWFNRPEVSTFFFENEEAFDLLYDEEFLEMMLYDEAARNEWFSQNGIEL